MRTFRLRYLLIGLALTPVLLAATVLWMAGGLQSSRSVEANVSQLEGISPRPADDLDTLRILVWNIAWGYGEGSEGTGEKKPALHFEGTINAMAAIVRASGADIVMLQEIDFGSTRSYEQDQARAIAAAAGLPYVAAAVSWTANWVPFPYWPPADHFGRMSSGGAIISRYPLSQHQVELLPKPQANAFHYNLFYLFRYAQQARAQTPIGEIQLINVHLEAFDETNRLRQASLIAERFNGAVAPLTVLAGDFNAVPPEAPVRAGFPDEPAANFIDEQTLPILRSISGMRDAVPRRSYRTDPRKHYTYPASAPNRTLDHALVSADFEVRQVRVYREAGELSDHLPLLITLAPAQR